MSKEWVEILQALAGGKKLICRTIGNPLGFGEREYRLDDYLLVGILLMAIEQLLELGCILATPFSPVQTFSITPRGLLYLMLEPAEQEHWVTLYSEFRDLGIRIRDEYLNRERDRSTDFYHTFARLQKEAVQKLTQAQIDQAGLKPNE